MEIILDTLKLVRYDEKYSKLKESFEYGDSKSSYISSIGDRLDGSKFNDKSLFQSAFVVLNDNNPIGYLFISSMIRDEVYLEYAVLNEYRGYGFGKIIIDEVSEYLFNNLNVKTIKLDIDPSNIGSMKVALSCGFFEDDEEYEDRNFEGKIKFIKESYCYVPKRRKGH